MPYLKQDLKKKLDGRWDELHLTFGEHEAKIQVLATSPFVLRLGIKAPKEIDIERK